MSDTKFLEKHGQKWRVVIGVPRQVARLTGVRRLKQSTGTDSLAEARRRRWPVVAKLRLKLRELEEQARASDTDPLVRAALAYHEGLIVHEEMAREGKPDAEGEAMHHAIISQVAKEVEAERGPVRANEFRGIATGEATPLLLHMERWLRESERLAERTKGDHRHALKLLERWARKRGLASVESITRRIAGDFISECFIAKRAHPKTARKRVSNLSSYWRWLDRKGLAPGLAGDNPWRDQPMPEADKRRKRGDAGDDDGGGKRPFTDDEMRLLFYVGRPEPLLADFMHV
jgi:hypothetical protein